jgi:hypothetical protein
MLKIKVSTKESAEITQIVHFRESDIINIVEENGITMVVLVNRNQSFTPNGLINLYTREPIELSEYSSLVEPKEKVDKVQVEYRQSGGFIGNRLPSFQTTENKDIFKEGGEAVIYKDVKKEHFSPFTNLGKQIEELKQRLDKIENK